MPQSDLERSMLFQMKAIKLPAPVEQYVFHADRKWRFDFGWPGQRVALEVEGGTWVKGRHVRPTSFEEDAVKYAEALLLGWRVLRVTNHMVEDGRALRYLERLLAS